MCDYLHDLSFLFEQKKASTPRKKQPNELQSGMSVEALVELVKDEYLVRDPPVHYSFLNSTMSIAEADLLHVPLSQVLTIPHYGSQVGFAATRDFNFRSSNPHQIFYAGQR